MKKDTYVNGNRNATYMMENVFRVIGRRVYSGKLMIITTNLIVRKIRETKNLDEKRIYDYVLEYGQQIYIKGENYRREKRRQNRNEFEQIFHREESE